MWWSGTTAWLKMQSKDLPFRSVAIKHLPVRWLISLPHWLCMPVNNSVSERLIVAHSIILVFFFPWLSTFIIWVNINAIQDKMISVANSSVRNLAGKGVFSEVKMPPTHISHVLSTCSCNLARHWPYTQRKHTKQNYKNIKTHQSVSWVKYGQKKVVVVFF